MKEKFNIYKKQENIMGTKPVDRLLLSMAVPLMFSMLVQALYNIADGIFVSRISENALSAISISFSFQNFLIAVGVGTGVGLNALLSKSLGEKNFDRVNQIAGNGMLLFFISSLVFSFLSFFLIDPFLKFQTDNAEIISYAKEYLTICIGFSMAPFFQLLTSRLLQSTGKIKLSMTVQIIGAVINIVLDPILIFGLFGMPKMEIRGAAIATVFGQAISVIIGMFFNLKFNSEICFKPSFLKPNREIIGGIYSVGIPSMILIAMTSLMLFSVNKILSAFSVAAVAVFGVYIRLQSFIFMPIFGINQAMVPIISYNYGAKKTERIKKIIKHALIYSVSLMLIGLLIVQIFPESLLKMFDAGDQMFSIGMTAFRIISLCFIFAGINFVISAVFQSLGNPRYALFLSLMRQLIVLLPTFYILSLFGNLDIVWWAFPLAEIFSFVFCILFLKKTIKKIE